MIRNDAATASMATADIVSSTAPKVTGLSWTGCSAANRVPEKPTKRALPSASDRFSDDAFRPC